MVRGDAKDLLNEVWEGSTQLDKISYSLITLIPKKYSPERIGDYRPIALLNSSLNFVVKILANRLVPVLQNLISDN